MADGSRVGICPLERERPAPLGLHGIDAAEVVLGQEAKGVSSIDTVTHANLYSCLYAAHQRNRAVRLLVFKKERPMRKPADKVISPVLLDNPVLSHADIIQKTRLLYQFYCINKLSLQSLSTPLDVGKRLVRGKRAKISADRDNKNVSVHILYIAPVEQYGSRFRIV